MKFNIKREYTEEIDLELPVCFVEEKEYFKTVYLLTNIDNNKFEGITVNFFKEEKFDLSPKGTSITVKNLFYNVPARRKFLKSDSVELKYIIDEVQRASISHPEIHFIFYISIQFFK